MLLLSPMITEGTASLGANYRLQISDEVQIATAVFAECETFLKIDVKLRPVTKLRVIVLVQPHKLIFLISEIF